jgi:hypothetical protein
LSVLIVSVVLGCTSMRAWPQDVRAEQPPAIRLDFSINELEDGKKINVRHYSLSQTGGNYKELKIGTRVPVEAEQGKFQYLDVGTTISSKIYGKEDALVLEVRAEVSNFAVPDQIARVGQPLLRQMLISGTTVLVFDKSMAIGAVDDPNSKRQYQLEVTATKIK